MRHETSEKCIVGRRPCIEVTTDSNGKIKQKTRYQLSNIVYPDFDMERVVKGAIDNIILSVHNVDERRPVSSKFAKALVLMPEDETAIIDNIAAEAEGDITKQINALTQATLAVELVRHHVRLCKVE